MGLIPSKFSCVHNGESATAPFDGQCSDYPVTMVEHQYGPEWILGETDYAELRQQSCDLDSAPHALAEIPEFSFNGTIVIGRCVKVYDGDTVHFVVNYPAGDQNKWIRRRFRMIGYNSPEVTGETRDAGLRARDYLAGLLYGKKALLQLHDFDKWGRVLCDVYLIDENCRPELHVNAEMIKKGYGIVYSGKRDLEDVTARELVPEDNL